MVLFGVFGELGAGKTLTQTYLLFKKWFTKNEKIYANYHLFRIPYMFVGGVDTFNNMRDGNFGGDELWLVVDSRSHKSAKLLVTNILAKSRKRKLTIYYTTQIISSMDKRVTKITDFVSYPMMNPKETVVKAMIFRGSKLHPGAYMRTIYFLTKDVFPLYDTDEEVVPWDEDPSKSVFKEDGCWCFQESINSPLLTFDSWEDVNAHARKYWKGKRVVV